jgi:vibriolysin
MRSLVLEARESGSAPRSSQPFVNRPRSFTVLNRTFRGFTTASIILSMAACQGVDDGQDRPGVKPGLDIQAALSALPRAEVVDVDAAGVPSFITGELGALDLRGDLASPEMAVSLRSAVSTLSPVMRLKADDLTLRNTHVDNEGDTHLRFAQFRNGLEVLGGELLVHVRAGRIFAFNGGARGDLEAALEPTLEPEAALAVARGLADELQGGAVARSARLAYTLGEGRLQMVYVVKVTGELRDGTPVDDELLVSALDGAIVRRDSHVQTARNRIVYTVSNGTSLPGSLRRSEGGAAATSDALINSSYDRLGTTYECYKTLFNRDSFDNAGAKLVSSIHYSNGYNNAYWNGSQMVYGDGDGTTMANLAASMDVTAHELTHAVTGATSNLVYSGESGGLNESMSDIFGNTCEWFKDGQVVSDNTWKVGEDIYTPGKSGDALRYMNDPKLDGSSLDYWTSGAGNVDVHFSSGIANLVFYLLSQGGTHPRGKSTVNVTGIGIAKASQIFYKANTAIFTSQTSFAAAKTATEQAASQLGYTTAEIASVTAAWNAVGVGSVVTPPTSAGALTNNVAKTALSAATGAQALYTLVVPAGATNLTFTTTGSTGDLDLYVQFGSAPTTSVYTCQSTGPTATEKCTISSIQAGTYYVLLNSYAAYSGVTLTGSYTAGSGGGDGGACAHNECSAGAKLTSGCDACVTSVCAADSFCCATAWDARCVSEVVSVCGQTCP